MNDNPQLPELTGLTMSPEFYERFREALTSHDCMIKAKDAIVMTRAMAGVVELSMGDLSDPTTNPFIRVPRPDPKWDCWLGESCTTEGENNIFRVQGGHLGDVVHDGSECWTLIERLDGDCLTAAMGNVVEGCDSGDCSACPAASIDVTLVADAHKCSGCVNHASDPDMTVDTLSVDGSYTLDYDTTLTVGSDTVCRYKYEDNLNHASWTEYASTNGTCGGSSCTVTSDYMRIYVLVYQSPPTKPVYEYIVFVQGPATCSRNGRTVAFARATGPFDYGTNIASETTCPSVGFSNSLAGPTAYLNVTSP